MSDLVFDQWVFGRTPGGTRLHAFKRIKGSEPLEFAGRRWDHTHIISGLCPARGSYGERIATNELFDPSARDNVCPECSRRWMANHLPEDQQIPGWTKHCDSCRKDRPINQFHVDKRTKDGTSKVCFDCTQASKAAIKAAERCAADEANRQRAPASAESNHSGRMEALRRFQDSSLLPTFRCTHGHALTPVRITTSGSFRWSDTPFPTEAWSCPCGVAPVDNQVDWRAIFDGINALDTLSSLPCPESVDVITSQEDAS